MGKKKSEDKEGAAKPTAFVLRVPMHCRCNGCDDKIRAGIKDLTLHHGIEALDQSALWTKGDLTVVSTADPEKLRRRLHKATGKSVDLFFPKPQPAADKAKDAAAMQELLARSLQQQGQYGHGQPVAWANHQALPGWSALQLHHQQQLGGYGGAGYGAPWGVQLPQPESYPSAAASWGAYAYPPASQGHGGAAYGGGWHAHGLY